MRVRLLSRNFEAFFITAQTLHFGKASQRLNISPSALSQRVRALEEQVNCKLFHRTANAVSITEAGDRLLRHCQKIRSLQDDLMFDLGNQQEMSGAVSIAAFSSVMRSLLMPSLSQLLQQNPQLHVHFRVANMWELNEVLMRGQADFIVTREFVERAGYQSILLGNEENVLVERIQEPRIDDVFLDHCQYYDFTEKFFLHHEGVIDKPLRRLFVNDIYGILDGVGLGLGRGVVPKHLLTGAKGLRIVPGYAKAWTTPIFLQFAIDEQLSLPMRAVSDTLANQMGEILKQLMGDDG